MGCLGVLHGGAEAPSRPLQKKKKKRFLVNDSIMFLKLAI